MGHLTQLQWGKLFAQDEHCLEFYSINIKKEHGSVCLGEELNETTQNINVHFLKVVLVVWQ